MTLKLTNEQIDLLAKLEQTGLIVTEAESNDETEAEAITEENEESADESINKLYNDIVEQLDAKFPDRQQLQEDEEVEPDEETTLECSACSVILSIDQVILNTLAQEGKLAISSVDNLLKLTEIRDMYMRY